MLTPTQALVLQTVTWWIRGSRQRGKSYTSATSAQVSEWIADKFFADVSPKAAQIALRHLVDAGFLGRQPHRQSGFSTVYRYVLTAEPEIHVTVPDDHRVVPSAPSLVVNKEKENQIREVAGDHEPSRARATAIQTASGATSLAQIAELCQKIGDQSPEAFAQRFMGENAQIP